MSDSWDDTPPDDCDAPESHPDGCACVRPGEEHGATPAERRERHVQFVEHAVGSLLPPDVTFTVERPRSGSEIDVYPETVRWAEEQVARLILGDDANKAFGEWMRGKEEVKAAGLLFERELGSGDNMLETDDELRSRLKERLRQMSEAGAVAVAPGLAVRALPLHEMTRDQLEEYAEMMGIAEPKEST